MQNCFQILEYEYCLKIMIAYNLLIICITSPGELCSVLRPGWNHYPLSTPTELHVLPKTQLYCQYYFPPRKERHNATFVFLPLFEVAEWELTITHILKGGPQLKLWHLRPKWIIQVEDQQALSQLTYINKTKQNHKSRGNRVHQNRPGM